VQAGAEREQGDDQLGRVAERDVQQAADARARPGGELLLWLTEVQLRIVLRLSL